MVNQKFTSTDSGFTGFERQCCFQVAPQERRQRQGLSGAQKLFVVVVVVLFLLLFFKRENKRKKKKKRKKFCFILIVIATVDHS